MVPVVNTQIFNSTEELLVPEGTPTNEENVEIQQPEADAITRKF